jgi:hypothetical protein
MHATPCSAHHTPPESPKGSQKPKALAWCKALLLWPLLALCACKTLWLGYDAASAQWLQAAAQGQWQQAYGLLGSMQEAPSALLILQERGRIASLGQQWHSSQEDFEAAAQGIQAQQQRAQVSLSHSLQHTLALGLGDTSLPYEPASYEKVFIHTFKMLNFLAQNELEKALVESRRALNEQRFRLQTQAFRLAATQQAAKDQGLELHASDLQPYLNQAPLAAQPPAASSSLVSPVSPSTAAHQALRNGYLSYCLGLLYEHLGQHDEAHIAYQDTLSCFPDNAFVQKACVRTGQSKQPAQDAPAKLVILYEAGFAPALQSFSLSLPWQGRWYTLSLPYYAAADSAKDAPPLHVHCQGPQGSALQAYSATVCLTAPLAAQALRDSYPGRALRQLLRLIVRDQSQKALQQAEGGQLPLAALGLLGVVLDKADTRSWRSLPRSVQVAECTLQPHQRYQVQLQMAPGTQAQHNAQAAASAAVTRSLQPRPGHLYIWRVHAALPAGTLTLTPLAALPPGLG